MSRGATLKNLDAQRENIKQLQAAWLPFGSPEFIRTCSNIILVAMCYYTAFYLINTRSYLTILQHVLVVSSVAIVVCIFMPMSLLTFSIVNAVVNPDLNLIGEVMEYMGQLHQIRADLCNMLIEDMKLDLYKDVSKEDVKRVFDKFDTDHDWTIDLGEFVVGVQMIGVHMSESKVRNSNKTSKNLDENIYNVSRQAACDKFKLRKIAFTSSFLSRKHLD